MKLRYLVIMLPHGAKMEIFGSWVTGHKWKVKREGAVWECACGMTRTKPITRGIKYQYYSDKFDLDLIKKTFKSKEEIMKHLPCPLSENDHLVADILK